MSVVVTTDLKTASYEEAAQQIRDYIGSHIFGEEVRVYDDPGSLIAFEVDQGQFVASAYRDETDGTFGFIRDIRR